MHTLRISKTSTCHTDSMEEKKLIKNKTLNKNYYVFNECKVNIQGKDITLEEINTKMTYWHPVNRFSQRPTSEAKWNQKIYVIIDEDMWNIIYTNYQKLVKDTTILIQNNT